MPLMRVNKGDKRADAAVICALAGTFAAGKTAAILPLIEALEAQGVAINTIAVIMIDAAGIDELYHTIAARVRLEIMPNGCFTCGDPDLLRQRIKVLEKGGFRHIIFEGFGGVVTGDELASALRLLGRRAHILALVDGQQYGRNEQLGIISLILSHITAATLGVIVTKVPVVPAVIEALVGKHKPSVPMVAARAPMFPEAWAKSLMEPPMPSLFTASVTALPLAGQAGVHGWQVMSFRLKPGTSVEELTKALGETVREGKLRVKGVAGNSAFSAAPLQEEWDRATADGGASDYCVIYCQSDADTKLPADFWRLVSAPVLRGYEQLRSSSGDPEVVAEMLAEFCRPEGELQLMVSVSPGGHKILTTHPESGQVIIGFSRRSEHKAAWFAAVIEVHLAYWCKCAEWLEGNGDKLQVGARALHERELGVSLAWWVREFGEVIDEELRKRVYACEPSRLTEQGLAAKTTLGAGDDFWRMWWAIEFFVALCCCREGPTPAMVDKATDRVVALVATPEEREALREILKKYRPSV